MIINGSFDHRIRFILLKKNNNKMPTLIHYHAISFQIPANSIMTIKSKDFIFSNIGDLWWKMRLPQTVLKKDHDQGLSQPFFVRCKLVSEKDEVWKSSIQLQKCHACSSSKISRTYREIEKEGYNWKSMEIWSGEKM